MANDLSTRVSIDTLSTPGLALLRQGYAAMQAINDDRGFNYIAGIHGVPAHFCHTVDILFLPWHRAYLYTFEQSLRDRVAGTCVPWWDWTSTVSHSKGLPQAFTSQADSNPLLKSHIFEPMQNLDRDTTRSPGRPRDLPTPDEVATVLNYPEFRDFSEQLEQIHNRIHGWVSGDMGFIATAAFDPIFYSHHAMIDRRLWYIWQVHNGVSNIPQELLLQVLQPFNLKVSDVLDVTKLGYQYAVGHVTTP